MLRRCKGVRVVSDLGIRRYKRLLGVIAVNMLHVSVMYFCRDATLELQSGISGVCWLREYGATLSAGVLTGC